jgi:hypothetical protein
MVLLLCYRYGNAVWLSTKLKVWVQVLASGDIGSRLCIQIGQSTTAATSDKPQQKLTLKFHSVLSTVRHSHVMTPQLCGTAGPVYK